MPKVKKIEPGIYRITEKLGVGCYLVIGSERALLIDTGYGKADLKKTVSGLTSLPVTVVNTHLHPDHSGGNKFFGAAMVGEADLPARAGVPSNALLQGVAEATVLKHPLLKRPAKWFSSLMHLDADEAEYSPLPDAIDLGGRTVRVLPCPGHTAGSVLLVDGKSRLMFAGDAINAALWLFTCPESTTGGYAATIDSLLPEIESCRAICIAHSGRPLPPSFARVFKEVLENIKAEDCRPLPVEGTPEPLLICRKKTGGYSFGIFLFGSQIKQKAADSPSEH